MADFARRASEEFAKDDLPAPTAEPESSTPEAAQASPQAAPAPRPMPAAPVPLQAQGLIWVVIKAYLARLGRWLGLAR